MAIARMDGAHKTGIPMKRITRDQLIARRQDTAHVPIREGLVMAGGFIAFNVLAVAAFVYLRLLLHITPVISPWAWSVVSTLCIAVLPISSMAVLIQLGDYSRRARGVGTIATVLGVMLFSAMWAGIIFMDVWRPKHMFLANWHMGNVCEAICPAELFQDYQQDVRHSMQRLQEMLMPPAPLTEPDQSI
jgi:hypothetical protein